MSIQNPQSQIHNCPTIVAHRGLHNVHPENSLAAFLAAWEAGVHWCECDVQGTKCRTPLVMHDDMLGRTTTTIGRVDQVTWPQVAHARLRRADGSPTDEPIPTLAAVLAALGSHELPNVPARMLIEIKVPCPAAVIETVMRSVNPRACAVQAFDAHVLADAHARAPAVATYFLTETTDGLDQHLAAPWRGMNIRHDLLTSQWVERFHAVNKTIGVWTPNSPDDLRRAISLGADFVITDEPLRAMDMLADLPANGSSVTGNR